VFAAVACGSSKKDSNTEPDASLLGTGGSVGTGSGGSTGSGSGGTSSNGTGTGNGSGTGGSAAAGTGGNGGMMTGTGGFGGFNRDGGTPMMLMCPATQPMDGDTCMGGGFGGFGGRGMSCMFGDTSCRCRRGMWRCFTEMPPGDNDAGM
jgi:hypothetical protein